MSFKILIFLAIFSPLLVQGEIKEARLGLEDFENLDTVYERSRQLLSVDEVAFLEEILAVDDAIMERQKRGIVDQILAAIAGVAPGVQILGPRVTVAAAAPVVQAAAPVVSAPAPPTAAKSDINTTCGQPCASANNNNNNAAVPAAVPAATMPAAMQPAQTQDMNENHLFGQISKVIINSATRNVTGIVDEALKIGTPAPVRDLVNGILGVAYCNGIRRLLGRC